MRPKRKKEKRIRHVLMNLMLGLAVLVFTGAVAFLALQISGKNRLYSNADSGEMISALSGLALEMDGSGEEGENWQYGDIRHKGIHYRYNEDILTFLFLGIDRMSEVKEVKSTSDGGQSDAVFLLVLNPHNKEISVIGIPRDTMTEITLTDLSGNVLGKDIQHLTLAYAYGDGREKSCELVAEAVSDLLGGLKIDHYMAGNIEIINILNDSVGGVTVTVPTSGMEKRDAAFVEGATITLHGEQAESFVRYRDIEETHSAIYRMSRQREYIMQFFGTVKRQSARNSAIVTDMLDLVEDYMVTDMGKEEYLKIALDALEMAELAPKDFYVVPGQAVMTEVYDEFHADREALTPIILELFYREAQ